jgi:hypothetical protein
MIQVPSRHQPENRSQQALVVGSQTTEEILTLTVLVLHSRVIIDRRRRKASPGWDDKASQRGWFPGQNRSSSTCAS